jgi:hypothetical protein
VHKPWCHMCPLHWLVCPQEKKLTFDGWWLSCHKKSYWRKKKCIHIFTPSIMDRKRHNYPCYIKHLACILNMPWFIFTCVPHWCMDTKLEGRTHPCLIPLGTTHSNCLRKFAPFLF